jgi:hypothetical protein
MENHLITKENRVIELGDVFPLCFPCYMKDPGKTTTDLNWRINGKNYFFPKGLTGKEVGDKAEQIYLQEIRNNKLEQV